VTSTPIPGWGNWDCSLRNCLKGDSTVYGSKSVREVQRVVCTSSLENYFQLVLFKQTSAKIYGFFNAYQIKDAIEIMPGIGNVSIGFPNDGTDMIVTACNSSSNIVYGGFLVRFETQIGDLPLFSVLKGNVSVKISEFNKGVSSNEECSGSFQGFCDRNSGNCVCDKDYYSSDGARDFGARGDCSYKTPHPSLTYSSKLLI